jgi:hypothetical protein
VEDFSSAGVDFFQILMHFYRFVRSEGIYVIKKYIGIEVKPGNEGGKCFLILQNILKSDTFVNPVKLTCDETSVSRVRYETKHRCGLLSPLQKVIN